MAVVDRLMIKCNKFTRPEDVVEAVKASPLFAQKEIETGPEVCAPGFEEMKYCYLFFKENEIYYSIEEAPDYFQRTMIEYFGFVPSLEISCRKSSGPYWISYLKFMNFLLSEDDGDAVLLANGEDTILERFSGNLKLNRKYFDESIPIPLRSVPDGDIVKIFTIPYSIEDLFSPLMISNEEFKDLESRQDPRIMDIINRKKNKDRA